MSNAGKYQVLKHLASGGMAEVFLARERSASGIEKLVVLKRVLPAHAKDAEFLKMFKDEARIGALLQHPNLVQMFEMGTLDGSPYISMEYLNGEDVRSIFRVLRRNGQPMKLETTLTILSAVCAGLHCAHEAVGVDGRPLAIVHRDVSPQNVIVTYEGGVKVVDFGIARSENRLNKTENSVLKGKVSYMAPEQVLGATLDRRADVYAVGVMLYEMTTGRRPHQHENEVAIIRSILDAPVDPPERLIPGYPPELSAIVQKAMARERDVRYPTAQALQEALEAFAAKKGMSLSTLALGRTMRELFGERADAYRQVLAGTSSPDVLQAPTRREEAVEDGGGEALGEGPVLPTDGRGTVVETSFPAVDQAEFKRVGPVTVVSFRGKLNEKFSGATVGGVLSGQVVFDLRRIERVTSFGVREWLQMLAACEPRVSELYLVQCSEPVVSQLSMVKRFSGHGRVVSFFAPFHCPQCDETYQGLLEVNDHAEELAAGNVPQLPCPRCCTPGDFDDDARSYLAFGPVRLPPLPPAVEAAVAGLRAGSAAAPERVEKFIEGTLTRVKVRAALDGSLRWRRVLDGVEGEVAVELLDVPRFDAAGVRQLGTALAALGEDVTAVRLVGAPRPVLEACADALRRGRVAIESAVLDGNCPRCQAPRSGVVKLGELRQAVSRRRQPYVPCRRCDTQLTLGDVSWLERLVGEDEEHLAPPVEEALPETSPAPAHPRQPTGQLRAVGTGQHRVPATGQHRVPATGQHRAVGARPPSTQMNPVVRPAVPQPRAAWWRKPWVMVLAGAGVALVSLGVAALLLSTPAAPSQAAGPTAPQPIPRPAPAPAPAPKPAPAAQRPATSGPPEWAQGPAFVEGAQQATAWAHAGPAPTDAEAREAAEAAALARLSEEFFPSKPALRERMARQLAASTLAGSSLREALERRVDGPLPVLLASAPVAAGGHEAWAQARVPIKSFVAAVVESAKETLFRGATLVALPPHLGPAGGGLYVVQVMEATPARAAGLREGDVVVELDGAAVPTVGALEALRQPLGQQVATLKVDAQGVPRTLKVTP